MEKPLLQVNQLEVSFQTHVGEVQAIRGINLHAYKGETLGIVGESGSGKSVTMLSVMGLLPHPGVIKAGEVLFQGRDLTKLKHHELSSLRGNKLSMIFQDPMTCLNPVYTVGEQISETLRRHQKVSRTEAKQLSIAMLEKVGIPSAAERYHNYPHQLSGGMRQRCMIAMSMVCDPAILIADEPTTALDVTIQAQIIELMKEMNRQTDTAIILITHDLGVVADLCRRVVVMYGGLIMEEGRAEDLFYNSRHPYTQGLLKAVPSLEMGKAKKLFTIKGTPPNLLDPPQGCPFARRCDRTMQICLRQRAPFQKISTTHQAACWRLHPACPAPIGG